MGSPYTSARAGLWDASDVDTWGQGLGVYPQTANDVVNIAHTVTYNKVSTTEMGAITINSGGLLTFRTDASTKLTLGHVDLTINNGGELRVGTAGAKILKNYTAELVWNTTADNAKGYVIAGNTARFNACGDSDYYGSKYDYILATQVSIPAATNAVTITVVGNHASKFSAGRELLIHKGGTFAHIVNDFARLAVVSAADNGANTDISCTVTERPGASLTCLVGADVLNVSRNVLFYKLNYNASLGNQNTNRPRANNVVSFTINTGTVRDVLFAGWQTAIRGNQNFYDGVIRNGGYSTYYSAFCDMSGVICSGYSGPTSSCNMNVSAFMAGLSYSLTGGTNNLVTSSIFGCTSGLPESAQYNGIFSGYVYSCSNAVICHESQRLINATVGKDRFGVVKANAYDFNYSSSAGFPMNAHIDCINVDSPSSPVFNWRGGTTSPGRFRFEHYKRVANAHYVADNQGDVTKILTGGSNPTQRSGGNLYICEVVPQSSCAIPSGYYVNWLDIFPPIPTPQVVRLWGQANMSITFRFYFQTDFTALAKNALVLYADYLDQVSGGHLATTSSSTTGNFTTRADQSDWSQYVEVTVNPAQAGWVTLYLRLMQYESGKKVWVDPLPESAGKYYQVSWSYGEVVITEYQQVRVDNLTVDISPRDITATVSLDMEDAGV